MQGSRSASWRESRPQNDVVIPNRAESPMRNLLSVSVRTDDPADLARGRLGGLRGAVARASTSI